MIHPLWPTLTIRGGQSDQPYTERDDWLQSWQPINVPVEGDGNDRVKVELSASIDPAYYHSPSDWHAVLPSVAGLEFWTAHRCGTQLTADGGNLINQALSGGSYTGTVYVSEDPSFAATQDGDDATLQQIAFHAEIVSPEAGDPSGGDVVEFVPCTADTNKLTWSLFTCTTKAELANLDAQAKEFPNPNPKLPPIGIVSTALSRTSISTHENSLQNMVSRIVVRSMAESSGTNKGFQAGGVNVPANALKYYMFPLVYIADIQTNDPEKVDYELVRNDSSG